MSREVLYTGSSMNPHFRVGDALLVVPCGAAEIRPGDVVIFPNPQTGRQMVHRVVALTLAGVTTKGDNNPRVDDWLLKPRNIQGKVVAIRRKGHTLPVPPGVTATYRLFRAGKWVDRVVSRLLHPLYHRLARTGKCCGWLEMRLMSFPRPEGTEWQLWLGKRLVGRKLPTWTEWSIRRPFRLFVDEASLPESSNDHQSQSSS